MASSKGISKSVLVARIRQLLAVDQMAMAVYMDLASNISDPALKNKLLKMAGEESEHIAQSKDLLSLLSG